MTFWTVNFLLVAAAVLPLRAEALSSCDPCISSILEGKIPCTDQRYRTFHLMFELLKTRHANIIVETGTAREGSAWCVGDGCSTLLFAEWVKRNGGVFFSVDIDQNALKKAESALGDTKNLVHLVWNDSVDFLTKFHGTIDCLYLDSFDFDFDNPTPSQEHHLKEIQAAYPHLTNDSVVIIDDCDLPHGGKGKLAIEFLLQKGWKIYAQGYQVILVR